MSRADAETRLPRSLVADRTEPRPHEKAGYRVEGVVADGAVAERILSTAALLFSDRGYHAVGIRELAEAVGLSTSTLYHYYRNKQQILFAIIERFLVEFHDHMLGLLHDLDLPPERRLGRAVVDHVLVTTQRREELLVDDPVLNVLSERQQARITKLRREYRDAICSVIVEGVAAGAFQVAEPMVTTMAMLDMLDGVRNWYRPGHQLTLEKLAECYRKLALSLCRGYRDDD